MAVCVLSEKTLKRTGLVKPVVGGRRTLSSETCKCESLGEVLNFSSYPLPQDEEEKL